VKAAVESPAAARSAPQPFDNDATIVGRREERSAEEWDRSPTHTSASEPELEADAGARMTHVGAPPPAARASMANVHDPKIVTSQAIRVVVWRDAQGVHIAPAGTVVTALTIDAVLVALDPTADLTAWLSERTR
jgi:hypothetical protein